MSYISQEEKDFDQAERLAFCLTAAFILAFITFKWDFLFPPGNLKEAISTTDSTAPRQSIAAAAAIPDEAIPKPKPNPRQKPTREVAAGGAILTAAPADPDKLVPATVEAYIEQWAPTAIAEHRRTGVPASISLAQGIIESHAGKSILALSSRNHFGLKCHEKHKGNPGHCANFTDDIDKDFFLNFQNPAKSWKYHSDLLCRGRYQQLHGRTWKGWALGLKKVGYATDPNYAEKLIRIVEAYHLFEYDN